MSYVSWDVCKYKVCLFITTIAVDIMGIQSPQMHETPRVLELIDGLP